MIFHLLGMILVGLLMIYGLCMIIGGPGTANGFATGVGRTIAHGVVLLGEGTGWLGTNHPIVMGIIMVVLILATLT